MPSTYLQAATISQRIPAPPKRLPRRVEFPLNPIFSFLDSQKSRQQKPLKSQQDSGYFDSLAVKVVAVPSNQGEVSDEAFGAAFAHMLCGITAKFPTAIPIQGGLLERKASACSRTLQLRADKESFDSHPAATDFALSTRVHFDATGLPTQSLAQDGFTVSVKPEMGVADMRWTRITIRNVPFGLMRQGFAQHVFSQHPSYSCNGNPLVHVVAEYMDASELLLTGVTAFSDTIVAYVVAPALDKGLRDLPRTITSAEGQEMTIGVKYIPNTPAALPPPPPGPPPSHALASQGQVVGATNAPASMEVGGTFVAPAVQGTDTVMTDAALAAAPVDDVPAPEDPVQIAADMIAQREEACYMWLEDNSDVELSGGESQNANGDQIRRAIERVRVEHAHVFNAPAFSSTPHTALQVLLTTTLQEVFDTEGFTNVQAPPSGAPTQGTPTQHEGPPAKGPQRGPNKDKKQPRQQRARSTSPARTASASARAFASASQHARAPAARGRGSVPTSSRSAKDRVQGAQAAAGPTGTVRRPAHRSMSPNRSSRTTSEAAVVTRSGRVSHPVSGMPHWSGRGPTA
jgi:hypothetical protein